ncbi:MAG: DUF3891 family protein, partial [Catalinimonas sp.]
CHLVYLYEPKRALLGVPEFLDAQHARQARWREALGVTAEEVSAAYRLFRWCDQCSLILSGDKLPPGGRDLEVADGPDGTRHFIRQRPDDVVTVSPWPFEVPTFEVELECRVLTELKFADDEALSRAVEAAAVETKCWQFRTEEA